LDLTGCRDLLALPDGLRVPVLVARGCRLKALPANLSVDYLDIQDCTELEEWPDSARVSIGTVTARNCTALRRLPSQLGPLTSLDLSGCRRLEEVPPGVQIRSWIDLADTRITSLPEPLSKTGLRWRGVTINAKIAFFPESINSSEILAQPNAEVRRVMLERVGFERFVLEAKAELVHQDRDAGGPRKLYRVKLPGDEDVVCISVNCPSTGRHYVIRVPPTAQTCHQAIAWTAGFDNPDDYRPIVET
jgi:hypothetical protein